jgi:hypothetical protein
VVFVYDGHTVVQPPQCDGSNRVSTQLPLHEVVFPEQLATHMSIDVLQTRPPVHVVVPATQRLIVGSHVSVPLHITPSEQLRGEPTHAPLPLHVSFTTQNCPVLQLPVRGDQFVVDIVVSHA